jgi:hypothetical protein
MFLAAHRHACKHLSRRGIEGRTKRLRILRVTKCGGQEIDSNREAWEDHRVEPVARKRLLWIEAQRHNVRQSATHFDLAIRDRSFTRVNNAAWVWQSAWHGVETSRQLIRHGLDKPEIVAVWRKQRPHTPKVVSEVL